MGFIFQFFNLLPTLSAWENVAIPRLLDGVRLGKAKPDAVRLLDRVGLGNRTQHRPAELSGGQMQRVAVARALMMDPPLILADEPTGNLDSTTGASILALLAEVAHEDGRGRLVVMVTHNSDAAAATDRVITLQDGRVGSDVMAVGGEPGAQRGSKIAAAASRLRVFSLRELAVHRRRTISIDRRNGSLRNVSGRDFRHLRVDHRIGQPAGRRDRRGRRARGVGHHRRRIPRLDNWPTWPRFPASPPRHR